MAKRTSFAETETGSSVVVSDPLGALCQALLSSDETEDKVQARRSVSGMAQRPWQQLPVSLRKAVRADVARLREGRISAEEIVAKGYGRAVVDQALRDLGHGGA